MSTVYGNSTSDLAIDNIPSLYPDVCNCCSMTKHERPWWQIDLGKTYTISAIEVLGRADVTQGGTDNRLSM